MSAAHTVGSLRFESHMREIAGLVLLTAAALIFEPLPDIASLISGDGQTPKSDVPLWELIGSFCILTVGIVGVFVGYNVLVHGIGYQHLTAALIVGVQTAYIGYITLMVDIGKQAHKGYGFIPAQYNPSKGDVRFVGAMGIFAVITYAFSLVGSNAFFLFCLHAYQSGHPEQRPASYYRGRMLFYSGVLLVAGLTQMMLGSYIIKNFGGGDLDTLEYGPIAVAVYVVCFPAINVFVGLMQMLNGIWGMYRAMRSSEGPECMYFQWSMYFAWFLQLVLQVVVQIGYVPGAAAAQAAAQVFALSVGLNLMPAYLDYKMRSMPDVIEADYYGVGGSAPPVVAEEEPQAKNLDEEEHGETPTPKNDDK